MEVDRDYDPPGNRLCLVFMTLQFIALNWRQRTQSRAQVRLAIEDVLDAGLARAYTPELYHRKCSDLFEHIYERYLGEGTSVYESRR